VHILKQVCHSLDEAHQNGLTHRDIKPANIFVSGTGTELDFAKVLDFGLVQLRAVQTGHGGTLTTEATVACTPGYAAPEIARGEASYDHRVDIYAVGCVAYWLVTGQRVFEANTLMQVLFDHASTPPPRPHTRTELTIPPDLEQVIMDCLERKTPLGGLLAQTWWRNVSQPAACPNRGHVNAPSAGGKPMVRHLSATVLSRTF
jgi:eukaryotic-like serine/threonine-protein kinase